MLGYCSVPDVLFKYTTVRVYHAARFKTKVKLECLLKELCGALLGGNKKVYLRSNKHAELISVFIKHL